MNRVGVWGLVARCSVVGLMLQSACATAPTAPSRTWRAPPPEPWQARPTTPAATVTAVSPVWQRIELKNGLTVLVLEEHTLPVVRVSVAVRVGTAMDAREPGLAALTWSALDEGMGDLSAVGVANAFADLGAKVDLSLDAEWGAVSVQVQRSDVERATALVSHMVRSPAFGSVDLERVKKRQLAALVAARGTPTTLATDTLLAEIYGSDHAYGHPAHGTVASLEKLKVSSVKRFWSEAAVPKNAALILVGDLSLDDARALAESHFGRWRGTAPKPTKPPPMPKPRSTTRIVVVDHPGAQHTVVRVGRAMTSIHDPELPQALVIDLVLGGLFSSRLNALLREDKGLTYGIESTLARRLGPSPFVIATDVQSDKTVDAVAEIVKQLTTMRREGVRADELAVARAHVVRSLPGLLAASSSSASSMAKSFGLGLPADHDTNLAAAIDALSVDALKATCDRLLVVEDFVVVLVGDRAAILAGLDGKGLGEVVTLSPEPSAGK